MHLRLVGRDAKDFPTVDDPAKILTVKIWDSPFRSSQVARFENLEGLEIFGLRDESFAFLVATGLPNDFAPVPDWSRS